MNQEILSKCDAQGIPHGQLESAQELWDLEATRYKSVRPIIDATVDTLSTPRSPMEQFLGRFTMSFQFLKRTTWKQIVHTQIPLQSPVK